MHRHSYQGRKFHRQRDQRRSLVKSLADSLVEHGEIETTVAKAKELRPYAERLITKAKKGDLHARRQVIAALQTRSSAHKLVDEIAPKLKDRSSGYLRVERAGLRRGDNAPLAKISFVDDLSKAAPKSVPPAKAEAKTVSKPASKPTPKRKPAAAPSAKGKSS